MTFSLYVITLFTMPRFKKGIGRRLKSRRPRVCVSTAIPSPTVNPHVNDVSTDEGNNPGNSFDDSSPVDSNTNRLADSPRGGCSTNLSENYSIADEQSRSGRCFTNHDANDNENFSDSNFSTAIPSPTVYTHVNDVSTHAGNNPGNSFEDSSLVDSNTNRLADSSRGGCSTNLSKNYSIADEQSRSGRCFTNHDANDNENFSDSNCTDVDFSSNCSFSQSNVSPTVNVSNNDARETDVNSQRDSFSESIDSPITESITSYSTALHNCL